MSVFVQQALGGVVALAVLATAALLFVQSRRRREKRGRAALALAEAEGRRLPQTLHPVINYDLCIGSLSCVNACPEGDILGVINGKAALIEGSNCIGHGRCELECPVDAISLVFGTLERGIDLPEIDSHFESSRRGVHIVGELGGMGLIKNAMTQGAQVAAHLAHVLGAAPRAATTTSDSVDVAIVGAGPAGLATAVGCRAAGLSFRVLERGKVGGTVASFPRHKIVMSEPLTLPLVGRFGKRTMSKESLLDAFAHLRRRAALEIETETNVEAIEGNDGELRLSTNKGVVTARKVVLAIGRRGTPRRLGVPGEDRDSVVYELSDPEQYRDARVLVVGGGDSALEAAKAVAAAGAATVVLSYRGANFGKCRAQNRDDVARLASAGHIDVRLESVVRQIGDRVVSLEQGAESLEIEIDFTIVCAGGELPLAFLQKSGVAIKRFQGEIAGPAVERAAAQREANRWLAPTLALVGLAIIAALVWMGRGYYPLDRLARLRSPEHGFLKPAGLWGHGVGIVATAFMMSNFLYALRKRWRVLKGTAPIRSWLTVHVFVGIMSPIVIAFHAAFQSRNHLATGTYVALFIVVGTGLIGRFLYALVPLSGDKEIALGALRGDWQRQKSRLEELAKERGRGAALAALGDLLREPAGDGGSLLRLLASMPLSRLSLSLNLWRVGRLFADRAERRDVQRGIVSLRRLHLQIAFNRSLKRFFRGWRVLHVTLSILLVLFITVHIAVSIYFGYRWIFS